MLAGIEVAGAVVSAAAPALTVGTLVAARLAADAALVELLDDGNVMKVDDEIVSFGDTVLARADLLAVGTELTMRSAEGASAVDAEAHGLVFTAGEPTEEAFFDFAGSRVQDRHVFSNDLYQAKACPSNRIKGR